MHTDRLETAKRGGAFAIAMSDPLEQSAMYNELLEREEELLAPDGRICNYADGTARWPDEIYTRIHGTAVLLSSEHATRHWSIDGDTGEKTRKLSEPGTAALGSAVARATHGTHIAMIGKQTGNANYQPGHPYKQHIQDLIGAGAIGAFISLHGMRTGLVSSLADERPYDMLIGIGNNPNTQTLMAAHTLAEAAKGLGLRTSINAPFLTIIRDEDGRYWQRVYSDGTPVTNVFAAPEYTTRAAAQRKADAIGLNLPTMQIELAGNIRIPHRARERTNVNPTGPYLAYEALRQVIPRITHQPSEHVLTKNLVEKGKPESKAPVPV